MKHAKPCRASVLAGAVVVGLSGCAGGVKSRSSGIEITSQPSGASVYASGVEIGETPLRINPGDVFSAGFAHDQSGLVYRYKGTLSLKRPGCDTYSSQVNDAMLAKDIHVKLDCAPGVAARPVERPMSADTAPSKATTGRTAPQGGEIEQRLRRIDRLREKGLITEREYSEARERILKEL